MRPESREVSRIVMLLFVAAAALTSVGNIHPYFYFDSGQPPSPESYTSSFISLLTIIVILGVIVVLFNRWLYHKPDG